MTETEEQKLIEEWKEAFYTEGGKLYWKNPSSRKFKTGDEAGSMNGERDGYERMIVGFKGRTYARARVIFVLVFGWLPDRVKHIDGNSLNDHPDNLAGVRRHKL